MLRLCFRSLLVPFIPLLLAAQKANSPEQSAIRELVSRYVDAREHRDREAVAKLFTPDADQLVSSGEWRRGRDAVVRGTLASSNSTGGHRTITIQTIRLLAPSVALADGPYELTGLAGGEDRKMWTTFLLTRGPEGWRIAAIRNMRPSPSASQAKSPTARP
ncbi:MAG: YybH family protein [Bryobacteraceae bacterium]